MRVDRWRDLSVLRLRVPALLGWLAVTAGVFLWPDSDSAWLIAMAGSCGVLLWWAGCLARLRRRMSFLRAEVGDGWGTSPRFTLSLSLEATAAGAMEVFVPRWPRGNRKLVLHPGERREEIVDLPALARGHHAGRLITLGVSSWGSPIVTGRPVEGELGVLPATRRLPFRDVPTPPAVVVVCPYLPEGLDFAGDAVRLLCWELWMGASRRGLRVGVSKDPWASGGIAALRRLAGPWARDVVELLENVRGALRGGADEVWVVGPLWTQGRAESFARLARNDESVRLRWIAFRAPRSWESLQRERVEAWLELFEVEGRSGEFLKRSSWSVERVAPAEEEDRRPRTAETTV